MKKQIKTAKKCMQWNVAPDALPGSATLYVFRTAGLTTVQLQQHSEDLQQWRQIRAEQDRAYEESLAADRAKVLMIHVCRNYADAK